MINKQKNLKHALTFGIISCILGFLGTLLFFTSLATTGKHLLDDNNNGIILFIMSVIIEFSAFIAGIKSWGNLKGRFLIIISLIGVLLSISPIIFMTIMTIDSIL